MKIQHLLLLTAALVMGTCLGLPTQTGPACKPHVNCRLPDCRCSDDPNRPGKMSEDATPQMVMLVFSNGLTNWTVTQYLNLFQELKNPNKCPPKATFFTEDHVAESAVLQHLYENGHEISLTTPGTTVPKTKQGWLEGLLKSTKKALDANIPITEMLGVYSPDQSMGGDDELQAMRLLGMGYDSSCVVAGKTVFNGQNGLWPFTYDFVNNNPHCKVGLTPNSSFPGLWQFTVPEMSFEGHKCSSLSGCSPYITTEPDTFSFLYNAFEAHYYYGRVPMIVNVDTQWIASKGRVDGLKSFLSTINRYETTWIVSMEQALRWIKYPEPVTPKLHYAPWACSKK